MQKRILDEQISNFIQRQGITGRWLIQEKSYYGKKAHQIHENSQSIPYLDGLAIVILGQETL